MEATIRLLRGLPEPEAPPMIAANVMRRIRSGETEPTGFERLRRTLAGIFEPSFVLPASAMAVAALVVVVVQGPGGSGLLAGGAPALDRPVAEGRSATFAPSLDAEARAAATPRARRVRPDPPMTVMRLEFAEAQGYADDTGRTTGRTYAADARELGLQADVAPTRRRERRPDGAAGLVASANGLVTPGGPVVVGDGAALASGAQPGRLVPRPGANAPRAIPVAGPAPAMAFDAASGRSAARGERLSAGGADVRDEWLAAGLRNPREFAHFLAGKSLAEQELWVERLAKRADERGLLTELVSAFEATGDETAQILADDFRAVVGAAASDFDR